MYYEWRPYVSVAERRRNAEREMQKLRKKGHPISPVVLEGKTIARTFWGRAWCENLERYSDFENRLPRGRTYVRNGSVVDLQISAGEVQAWVSGSELYRVEVKISAVARKRWASICTDCAGAIDSLVELLQGRFSKGVMERICQKGTGLFPAPGEIELSCSCPDWASMCKHVAATLYGIGARLDESPELLFRLRQVDEKDLLARAGQGLPLSTRGPAEERIVADGDLSELFGLDLSTAEKEAATDASPAPAQRKSSRRPKAAPSSEEPLKPKRGGRAGSKAKEPPKTRKTRSPKRASKKKAPKASPRRTSKTGTKRSARRKPIAAPRRRKDPPS